MSSPIFNKQIACCSQATQQSPFCSSYTHAPSNSSSTQKHTSSQSKKIERGLLLHTQSTAFRSYYLSQNKTVKDAEAALLETVKYGELSNAVWLVRQGVNLTCLENLNLQEDFMKVLNTMALLPGLESSPKTGDLDTIALGLGYGYKMANLSVMQGQLDAVREKVTFCGLSVPEFTGISHFEIQHFLREHYSELDTDWKLFLSSFGGNPKTISKEGLQILQDIQAKIKIVFAQKEFRHIALSELVDKCNPSWLIVRSTGREDCKENANAGGNASIPYVKPDHVSVSTAIGEVIASYFGEKSIAQRLQASDSTLFNAEPFMPVLLQNLVCETNISGEESKNNEIPSSGVLFTREEGKDPDVVTISAARGSNEGVVASEVQTDTYQVHPNGTYSTIRIQPTRFVAIANKENSGYHVAPITNHNKTVSHAPALSSPMVQDLSVLARELGKLYATADEEIACMDMEFTVLNGIDPHTQAERPIIYLLQIRPLESSKQVVPTFINRQYLKEINPTNTRQVKGTTLLAGGSAVRVIKNSEVELIVTNTITEALRRYLKHTHADQVKAIIIRHPAPLASHECVTFHSKGVPVIVMENDERYLKAETLRQEASVATPAIVCSQRALIYRSTNISELEHLIAKGLITYPGPVALSLNNSSLISLSPSNLSPDLLKKYLEQIDFNIADLIKTLNAPLTDPTVGLETLFDTMAMCEGGEAKNALALLIKKVQTMYHQLLKTPNADAMLLFTLVECMHRIVRLSRGHVLESLTTKKPQSMERLFPLKQLQALITQEHHDGIIGSVSLMNMHQTIRNAVKLNPASINLPNTPLSKVLMAVRQEGIREEFRDKWNHFLHDVCVKEGPQGLAELWIYIKQLSAIRLKTHWFNVTFQDYKNPTLKMVMTDLKENQALFTELQAHHTTLRTLRQNVSKWENPEHYMKNLSSQDATFQAIGFNDAKPASIAVKIASATPLGKAALIELFHLSIEVYDETIKAVSGSTQFQSKKQQATAFINILGRYHEMLRAATEIAKPFEKEIIKLQGNNAKASQTSHQLDKFETFLKFLKDEDFKIQRTINNSSPDLTVYHGRCLKTLKDSISEMSEKECEKLFLAREDFNVAAVALGSHTDLTFCIYWPRTIEELFTTYHQSMETLIKSMKTKVGMDKSRLPDVILPVCKGIEVQTKQTIAKMSVTKGVLDVVYNVPFRSHSSEILIRTNLNRPQLGYELHITVYGNEEGNRWKLTGAFGALMATVEGCSFLHSGKPQINYLNPAGTGVILKYQLSPAFAHSEQFGTVFKNMFMPGSITFDGNGSVNSLITGIAKKPGFTHLFPHLKTAQNWIELPESFFAQTLFPSVSLLVVALKKNNTAAIKKIIKGTFLALSSYGLTDIHTNNTVHWSGLKNQFAQFNALKKKLETYITVSQAISDYPNPSSFVRALIIATIQLSTLNANDALEIVTFLQENPKTKTQFQSVPEDLSMALKSPSERVQEKIALGDFAAALVHALRAKDSDLIDTVIPKWNEQVPASKKKEEFLKVISKTPVMSKEELSKLISSLQLNQDAMKEVEKYYETVITASERKQLSTNLETIGPKVRELGLKGASMELVDLSASALIGLSQNSNFYSFSCGSFGGAIKIYLGTSPFKNLLNNNTYGTTTKLFKGATFYLLDALIHPDTTITVKAAGAVKRVINDYQSNGQNDPSGAALLNCVFTILAGYRLHNSKADINSLLNENELLISAFEEYWKEKNPSVSHCPAASSTSIHGAATSEPSRSFYLKNLSYLGSTMKTLGSQGLSPALFKACAKALIGLSQTSKFYTVSSSVGSYQGLVAYLGKRPYNKVLKSNIYGDTTKLYKAATFYLLKGMHCDDPKLVAEAKKAFNLVLTDHKTHGTKDAAGAAVANCIKTIEMFIPKQIQD